MVGLAQLVSASGCGPEGRGFESHISPQKKREQVVDLLSFFSYIRLAASSMRGRVILPLAVVCASHVESYKANVISL